jgi:hypothetical protein
MSDQVRFVSAFMKEEIKRTFGTSIRVLQAT